MLKRFELPLLFLVAVIPIWNIYVLHQQLNLFELGLYLPGIDAILHGQVPFRDFFHLRGPFELYLPAFVMSIFGVDVAVLTMYFYIGTILTLFMAIILARCVMPCRWLVYIFVQVLVARTFPRVVYTYWGGMRYVWGLCAVWGLVKFILNRQKRWILLTGIFIGVAGLTSSEIGVSALLAASICLGFLKYYEAQKFQLSYHAALLVLGISVVVFPYSIYLLAQGALGDYISAQWIVATRMTSTFVLADKVPSTVLEFLHALFVPKDKNFHQMTPLYLDVGFVVYFLGRIKSRLLDKLDIAVLGIMVYGFMLYITGFRNLWASVFEMSLQPEKIVLFFLLARGYLFLKTRLTFKYAAIILAGVIVVTSSSYAITRFSKRFFGKLSDNRKTASTMMDLPRLKYHSLPVKQAEDLRALSLYSDRYIPKGQPILMWPELGALHFILDRPWVGKFPTHTLSWLDDAWLNQYLLTLQSNPPKFAITNKYVPESFYACYFPVQANRVKFMKVQEFINQHYILDQTTDQFNMYRLKQ